MIFAAWVVLVGGLTTTLVVQENNKMVERVTRATNPAGAQNNPFQDTSKGGENILQTEVLGDGSGSQKTQTKLVNVYLDTEMMALHSSQTDCWMTISGNVYD